MNQSAALSPPSPWLIQGGMGVAISNWRLARAVARLGQIGVVSGTAIETVFARRLQDHGVDEELRGVLQRFPRADVVDRALQRFASRRRREGTPYRAVPMLRVDSPRRDIDLIVLASFVEVALAKAGHGGLVGINLLTKIQLPTAASLLGAMLAGVDYVMMGAGVPTHIPGALDDLSEGREVTMPLDVVGASSEHPASSLRFDPAEYLAGALARPQFFGIVSSNVLATALVRRSSGRVDGLVVERPSAGGHNAPPRGDYPVTEAGEPVYGPRDEVDYGALNKLDVPYWIGGGVTRAADVTAAQELGARGVQVGTLFAYCRDSGMEEGLRRHILHEAQEGPLRVVTSLRASSTGYPFKVLDEAGSVSEPAVYEQRPRHCDLGYLRENYLKDDGSVGYRCAAEPLRQYARKGGHSPEAAATACLCNGLLATCGLAQVRADGYVEAPLVTSGDCVDAIAELAQGRDDYDAADVVAWLTPRVAD